MVAVALGIIVALIMLALLPVILAGLVLAISGALEGLVHLLAWIFRPLGTIIGWWNRLTHRVGYRTGRTIRAIINRIRRVTRKHAH